MSAQPPEVQRAVSPGRGIDLNERDLELLGHLADGNSTTVTASAMGISTNTVRTRIRRLADKLSVSVTGREEILASARRLGFV